MINPNYNMENFIENYLPVAQWELETLMEKKDQLINEVCPARASSSHPIGDALSGLPRRSAGSIEIRHAAKRAEPDARRHPRAPRGQLRGPASDHQCRLRQSREIHQIR